MVNSPMDIDMEAPRKSGAASKRQSKRQSRQQSVAGASPPKKTPRTVAVENVGTQTRRILKIRRRGEFGTGCKATSPSATGMKRKLFSSPTASPPSPGLEHGRAKLRRIAEMSPPRKSSVPTPARKSRARRSAAPSARVSTAVPLTLDSMTTRQLKNLLLHAGCDASDCIEKSDLVDKATRLGLSRPSLSAPSSSHVTPVFQPVAPKRQSRKHSGVSKHTATLNEIVRIEKSESLTCWDILDIPRFSTESVIRSKSKLLFRQVHPDKIQDSDLTKRAQHVFHVINKAVDEAVSLVGTTASIPPPESPGNIHYTVERGGTVVVLKWSSVLRATCFKVVAQSLGGHSIEQGSVANLTSHSDELEYAISTQSRAGNDELFRKGRLDVLITSVGNGGESRPSKVSIALSASSGGGGLKRHHTIC